MYVFAANNILSQFGIRSTFDLVASTLTFQEGLLVDDDERIDLVESSAAAAAELLLRPATVETTDKPSLRVVIVAEKKLQNVTNICERRT